VAKFFEFLSYWVSGPRATAFSWAWREAIRRGLEDAEWRRLAAQAGLNQAARFSWDRCAAETLAASS
jgi:glycosyltransferase involved in cell wall biosynthesis